MLIFFLKFIKQIITVLIRGGTAFQIGLGVSLGVIIGFTPGSILLGGLIYCGLIIGNVSFLGGVLGHCIAGWVRPGGVMLMHWIGYWLLTRPSLTGIWSWCYNTPVVGLLRLTNTVVLGGLVVGIGLLPILTMVVRWMVLVYRKRIHHVVMASRLMGVIRATSLFQWGYRLWHFV